MHFVNSKTLRVVAYFTFVGIIAVSEPAETQLGVPSQTKGTGGETGPGNALTRSQKERISREQHNIDRLKGDLDAARQRLMSLQRAAVSAKNHDGVPRIGATIVSSISDNFVLTDERSTIGYEANGYVAFVRRDTNGNLIITGLGTVRRVYPDYLDVEVVARGKTEQVKPEDDVYVIDNQSSPASLAGCFK